MIDSAVRFATTCVHDRLTINLSGSVLTSNRTKLMNYQSIDVSTQPGRMCIFVHASQFSLPIIQPSRKGRKVVRICLESKVQPAPSVPSPWCPAISKAHQRRPKMHEIMCLTLRVLPRLDNISFYPAHSAQRMRTRHRSLTHPRLCSLPIPFSSTP